jgi:V/A-type H+-transporting ATPase subunit K
MDDGLLRLMGWVGIFAPPALGAVGSTIGCVRGGQAACGAMLDQEGGYGRFVGVSAMPASQTIYGIVVMFTLNRAVTAETAPALFGIGVLCGLALMTSAMGQGACCAAAISSFKSKPEIFGLSVAPAAIVEGFAILAFVFAIVLSGRIPAPAAEAGGPAPAAQGH